MSLDLKTLVHGSLAALFGLGTDVAPAVTFYRPPGYIAAAGLVAADEVVVACQMIVAGYRPFDLWGEPSVVMDERIVILAGDLVSVSGPGPGPGDYLVDASGQRRDVVYSRLDPLGEYWLFHTLRTVNDDYGSLAAHGSAVDLGDLAAATAGEDWGTLA